MEFNILWLIPFFPLVSSVVIRYLGKKFLPRKAVHILACASIFLSFIVTLICFLKLTSLEEHERVLHYTLFPWIKLANLNVPLAFVFDPLSSVMTLVITGVGFLIHLYSTAYMEHEEDFQRYFAYLNLFTSMMLILVLGESILLMFVGWEGVGLCSYLLIGFWFGEKANADAGKKAFVVNRIGDFGVLIGMFTLFWVMGMEKGEWSLSFSTFRQHADVFTQATIFGIPAATFATLMLFVGATGKSAQIPLYVWLPDAMAGPTPVSALIHAATMVTAGIYTICRLSFLFDLAPFTLHVIAIIGAATALFAATIGLVQNDIKKVLAYSTVSQLGYMFLGCGVGAYASGLFHVITHAFFKALLFLGAGSVIHAMHHEQDIRKMGGLRKKIPITYYTFLIGTLAIEGIFPLAGFFSKDEILWQVWNKDKVLWGVGLLSAALTAFYMFRLLFLTFYGECRADHETQHHIHESPWPMTVPLVILAFLSIVAGWMWWPGFLPLSTIFPHWLEPVVVVHHAHGSHGTEIALAATSLLVACAGIFVAFLMYRKNPSLPKLLSEKFPAVQATLSNKYWIDEIYGKLFVNGTKKLAAVLFWIDSRIVDGAVHLAANVMKALVYIDGIFDQKVIDGLVNLIANTTHKIGSDLRKVETGQIQVYLGTMAAGVAFFSLIWMALAT